MSYGKPYSGPDYNFDDFTFKDFVSSRSFGIENETHVEVEFLKGTTTIYVCMPRTDYITWLRKFIP